jgi:peptidyl-prolyl cis-trans isomerase D
MRNNLKSLSWVLWLVILTFVGFVFVEWGTGGMSLTGAKNALLIVNGETVTADEFQKQLMQTIDNYRRSMKENFNKNMLMQMQLPQQLLQQSINSIIVTKEARRLKIRASDEELRRRIVNSPGFQRDGRFIGVKAYENLLAYNRIDVKEFEQSLRREIAREKLEFLLSAGLAIDPDRLEKLYHEEMDSVELDVVRLTPDRVKQEISAPREKIAAFYQANKPMFMSPERRAGVVIALQFKDFTSQVTISPQEKFTYYKENREMFQTPEKTRVSRILLPYTESDRETVLASARELSGKLNAETFAATASEQSKDEKAAAGGDWGLQGWRAFSPQEIRIINNLSQNEISTPVDTGDGFSILTVTEKTVEKIADFNEVAARIETILQNRKVNELVKTRLAAIFERIEKVKDIAAASKSIDAPVIETAALTNGETLEELEDMGIVSRKLFSMEEGETAFPVEFGKGMAVVRLQRIEKPEILSFEAAEAEVREKFIQATRLRLLQDEAGELADRLNAVGDEEALKTLLRQRDLEIEAVTYKRGNRLAGMDVKAGIDERIFGLTPGKFSEPITYSNAVLVVRATSIHVMGEDDFKNSREAFYQSKLEELRNRIVASYIYQKREAYDIRFNQELYDKATNAALSRLN